jgi:2-polyprenyl-3-methyl-5-hydroxy-6-metoxy-1,4-benzoquinol methylase
MSCRVCKSKDIELFFDLGKQPIAHALLSKPSDPSPTYPFKVAYCHACGFMQMIDHIAPEDLYKNYFTVSGWKNQPHVPRLMQLMEGIFNLNPKTKILEIGCNDGSFMEKLAAAGYKDVIGYEPTDDAYKIAHSRGLNVINTFFGAKSVAEFSGARQPDLVVSRQVIEHIPDLHEFLDSIAQVLKDDGGLVLELPDHAMNYETLDYTFWEEHVNYFTISTLRTLLRMHGFEVVHHETTLFSGKCLWVFAQKSPAGKSTSKPKNYDAESATRYRDLFSELRNAMHGFMNDIASKGAYLYGAGARSSNFVNFLGIGQYLTSIIDDQPEKQNKYVPGCNLLIHGYSDDVRPDAFFLLGVNTENEDKVVSKRSLKSFASISPPSRYLPAFWRTLVQTKIID